MKVEIEIKGNGNGKEAEQMDEDEMMDEMKMAIGKKLQKNLTLTRKERTLLAQYLLKEED
jgi:hypothetical protein